MSTLSSTLEMKEHEIDRLKKENSELSLICSELLKVQDALQSEKEKVRTLELDLAEKDVTTRVNALKDVINGLITKDSARTELEFLQSILSGAPPS